MIDSTAMMKNAESFDSYPTAQDMILRTKPREPVYCLYRDRLTAVATRFVNGFPGKTMFAVKANPFPAVLDTIWEAGIRCFDTASLPEIKLVRDRLPDAELFYMAPVRIHGTIHEAYKTYGVRNFVVDHPSELTRILDETKPHDTKIFVRTAVPNEDAIYDLSTKFGASAEATVEMIKAVKDAGAEPALAFNVGSMVMRPDSYEKGLEICADILGKIDMPISHLDIGGGFPWIYPDFDVLELEEYFKRIEMAKDALPLADDATVYCEPGRSMVADGLSLVVQVLLRKGDTIYINDGIYGSFLENNISNGDVWYPTQVFRHDGSTVTGDVIPMSVFGPTCDSLDKLPKPVPLPADIQEGDWIEVATMGAYSNAVRTAFNGFFPGDIVEITDGAPPALEN
ncbi:MAG: type III PLP-dependent enzyme [Rhodospirillales bacterium]|nr:type III PLP-dependent enzyme [Rhodospirillales bacterium]